MDRSIALAIRKFTLAPLMAAFMLIFLYVIQPAIFGTIPVLLRQLFFMSLLPLLAYPVQPLISSFRDKGRNSQRYLAMISEIF